MASLYPSLEDFKYDILMNSKHPAFSFGGQLRNLHQAPATNGLLLTNGAHKHQDTCLYPSFGAAGSAGSYCLQLPEDQHQHQQLLSIPGKPAGMVAPLSGFSQAHRLQPNNFIRPVVICKDSSGKVGLRLCAIQGGVFVVLVYAGSPAALAGLRFGDQILEINDVPVAGYSVHRVHELIKRASPDELRFAVRDRPFERTVTLHKDQNGLVGFVFNKHGRILSIVKDSSAARNGLLIDHNIIELNAQNVVGLDECEVRSLLDTCGDVVLLTVVPSRIFEHMVRRTEPKLIRKNMDHTAPEVC